MRLRQLSASVSFDASGPVVSPLPADGTGVVLPTTSFRLRFDRFLLPSTAIRQSVCLQSQLTEVRSLDDCVAPVFLEPTYDPVRQEVVYRQRADQPRLVPGTRYQLTALAPLEDDARFGFRAFDGAPLVEPTTFQFTVANESEVTTAPEAMPAGDVFCRDLACLETCAFAAEVRACRDACPPDDPGCARACEVSCEVTCPKAMSASRVLQAQCMSAGCHREFQDEKTGVYEVAAMGLDFGSAATILATAIGRTAHQTQTGEHAHVADRAPLRFGRAMPIIDPGSPGNSYALYKLVARPEHGASVEVDPAELERLRASVVVGMPMPPTFASEPSEPGGPLTPPKAPLEAEELRTLSAWIARGAPVGPCP